MQALNREAILAARPADTVEVPVPEWGEGACVVLATMGPLEYAELIDWMDTLGRPARKTAAPEPDDDGPAVPEDFTCDAPALPDAEPAAEPDDEAADDEAEPERTFSISEIWRIKLRWIVLTAVDPDTYERIFTVQDVEQLGRKNVDALNRLAEAARKLHHDTKEAAEDFAKNSERTPSDASGGD